MQSRGNGRFVAGAGAAPNGLNRLSATSVAFIGTALIATGTAVGFALGRTNGQGSAAPPSVQQVVERTSKHARRRPLRDFNFGAPLGRNDDAEPESCNDGQGRDFRAEQATKVLAGLRNIAKRSAAPHLQTPQEMVGAAWPFVEGWMAALQTVNPEVLEDVGAEIEASLCDSASEPTEQLLLVRLTQEDPLFMSERGLGCTIERYTNGGAQADIVLWSALEAWQTAGLPATPELDRLDARGSDLTASYLARIRGDTPLESPPPTGDEQPVSGYDAPHEEGVAPQPLVGMPPSPAVPSHEG